MASARKSAAKSKAKSSTRSLITWTKLPKGVDVRVTGRKSPQLNRFLKNAKLNPQDPCFGGNSCIV